MTFFAKGKGARVFLSGYYQPGPDDEDESLGEESDSEDSDPSDEQSGEEDTVIADNQPFTAPQRKHSMPNANQKYVTEVFIFLSV